MIRSIQHREMYVRALATGKSEKDFPKSTKANGEITIQKNNIGTTRILFQAPGSHCSAVKALRTETITKIRENMGYVGESSQSAHDPIAPKDNDKVDDRTNASTQSDETSHISQPEPPVNGQPEPSADVPPEPSSDVPPEPPSDISPGPSSDDENDREDGPDSGGGKSDSETNDEKTKIGILSTVVNSWLYVTIFFSVFFAFAFLWKKYSHLLSPEPAPTGCNYCFPLGIP